jgi:hypothetical protein
MKLSRLLILIIGGVAIICLPLLIKLITTNIQNYSAYAQKACAETFEVMPLEDFEGSASPFIQMPVQSIQLTKRTSFKQEIISPDKPYSGRNASRLQATYDNVSFGAYDHWVLRMPPLPFRGITLDRRTHFSIAWRGIYNSMVIKVEYEDGTKSALLYTDQTGPHLPNNGEDALRQNTAWKVMTSPDVYEWAKLRAKEIGASDQNMYVHYVGLTTTYPNPYDITVDRMVVWQESRANCVSRS